MNIILLNISDLNNANITIALVGMMIVFSALTILYLFFKTIPLLMDWYNTRQLKKKGQISKNDSLGIDSGVAAAISASLYLYFSEIHDEETAIMTIKKVSKTYSPWSSKLYSMRWPLR